MLKNNDITGIILAGGKSSRMGFDKCFIEHNEISLIQKSINVISEIAGKVIISANNKNYTKLGYKTVSDLEQNIGPIGGINVALQNSATKANIISPCDMPFINSELFKYLLSFYNNQTAIVPIFNGKVEPLTGVYSKNILPFIQEQIEEKKFKILSLLQKANALFVDITPNLPFFSEKMFVNINSKDDLEKL
ncbi:MAG: molybdenum cofactor guanylyltransferase [Bacteroidales bacterium]|nr:molybdenum cofactor guanylyltransferase [Bacteroidales bacterium]